MQNRKYDNIDIAKFVFALVVIALHTGMPRDVSGNVYEFLASNIYRCAVPFFFLASGFLFAKGDRGFGYTKRLVKPLLIWGIGYFFIDTLLQYLRTGGGKNFVELVVNQLHSMIVSGPPGAMWYLYVLLLTTCIINIAKRFKVNLIVLLVLWLILFVTGFRYNISFGVYVLCGYLLFKSSDKIGNLKIGIHLLLLLVTFALGMMVVSNKAVNLLHFLFDVQLFIVIAFGPQLKLPNQNIVYYARKMSTVMYYTHMLFVYAFECILKLLNIRFDDVNSFIFAVVVSLTILFGVVYHKLKPQLSNALQGLF